MRKRLAPRVTVFVDLGDPLVGGVLDLRLEHQGCTLDVFEQRFHLVVEQRQPVLHAGIAAAFADSFIEQVVALGRAERRDIAHAETANGFRDQTEFGHRHKVEAAHVYQRALCLCIEGADRFQRIAEEIEPYRLFEACGKQVEDAAAHRVFAALTHRRGARIAIVLEPADDAVHADHIAGRNRQRLRRHQTTLRHTLQDRVDRGEHDQRLVAALQPRQFCQCRDTLRNNGAVRRDAVIGLAIPGRELQHRDIRRKEIQSAGKLRHPAGVATDHGNTDRRRILARSDGAREIGGNQAFRAIGGIGKRQSLADLQQLGR